MSLNESIVEDAALEWFSELGFAIGHGPHLAPGEPSAERDSFSEVVLVGRMREAIRRLNPAIPEEAREEALRKVLRVGTPSLTQTNRAFHRKLRRRPGTGYRATIAPNLPFWGMKVRVTNQGESLYFSAASSRIPLLLRSA